MQVSYMILQRVSPVTHSVGNCVKRVVVIVSSVVFFRTPVSPINSIGIINMHLLKRMSKVSQLNQSQLKPLYVIFVQVLELRLLECSYTRE